MSCVLVGVHAQEEGNDPRIVALSTDRGDIFKRNIKHVLSCKGEEKSVMILRLLDDEKLRETLPIPESLIYSKILCHEIIENIELKKIVLDYRQLRQFACIVDVYMEPIQRQLT